MFHNTVKHPATIWTMKREKRQQFRNSLFRILPNVGQLINDNECLMPAQRNATSTQTLTTSFFYSSLCSISKATKFSKQFKNRRNFFILFISFSSWWFRFELKCIDVCSWLRAIKLRECCLIIRNFFFSVVSSTPRMWHAICRVSDLQHCSIRKNLNIYKEFWRFSRAQTDVYIFLQPP